MRQRVSSVRDLVAACVIAAGLGAPVLTVGAGPGGASPGPLVSANRYNPDKEECRFLDEINDFRRRRGEEELTLSPTLGAAAEHHSEDMARKDYFDHDLKGGPSWSKNIRQHGYRGNPIGENIAAGNADASDTFKQWEKSAGHRRNMLDGDFEAIGIGRAFDRRSEYGWYWTTTFGGEVDDEVKC